MGRITTGTGLVSGIDSKSIIDQLIQLEQRPKTLLASRQAKVNAQKAAYSGIIGQLTTIQGAARAFERPSTFTATEANSTDENVLTASTSAGAAVGSYQFQVARLVTSQQSISNGYADQSSTVGAGTISVELGGGNLNTQTALSQLNGGEGVRRGLFRITDRSGKAAVIDISNAVSVDDVLRKINTSLDIGVKAKTDGDKLVLTDTTGATANDLKVEDLADGHAAEDLGLVGNVAGTTLTGTDVVYLGQDLSLSSLNDGRGVRLNTTGADFTVTARDGSTTSVTLGGNSKTLGDVIKSINTAGGSKFKAQVSGTGNGLQIVDTSGGGGTLSIAAVGTSGAAADLGILGNGTGATLTGKAVVGGLNTVLLSSLKGGTGIPLGQISIKNRQGVTASVDLSGAKTVQDVLDTINNFGGGLNVQASLKESGNGIQLIDKSGGTGDLVVDDLTSTTAAALGLKGTFDVNTQAAVGANLQLQWVSENSQLSTYNGGKAVTPGIFTITNSKGARVDINLAQGTFNTLGDVIKEINSRSAGVTASVNTNGDGLLLTDTAGGGGKLKVENKSGTTATDLNIAGTSTTGTTIDGSFEKTIDVTAEDTLSTVQGKIRDLGFGVSAAIVNDGSGAAPYRLSITALNSGRAGRITFDAGATSLQTRNLVEAQDAAVFVGGANAAEPLLVTSSKNQLTNVIPGVTIDLHGVSTQPVTLNVTRSPDSLVDQVQKFVDTFNGVVDKVAELTKFDPDTNQGGLLLGEGTIQNVQAQIYTTLTASVSGAGRFNSLADLGIKLSDDAKIDFDAEKFKTAFAQDPDAVKNLFAQTGGTKLTTSTALSVLNNGKGVTVSGKPDFRISARDGTTYDVTVPAAGSIADVLAAINTATSGKITADITTKGLGLQLTDTTTGTQTLTVSGLNGSQAAKDLGLEGVGGGSLRVGNPIFTPNPAKGGGIGFLLEKSMASLIDPVDGVLVRENHTLDDRAKQFQDRIDAMDKLITDKRTRLERQFSNMESVLAKLQSQQSALGSLSGLSTSSGSK